MGAAHWTPVAESELSEIAYWIAVEDARPATARAIVEEIRDKADWYADSPGLGQRNADFPEQWLWFRHKRWVVVYQPTEQGLMSCELLIPLATSPLCFAI